MANDNKRRRIDISLPEKTIKLIDRIWPQEGFRSRSAFIDEAAQRYTIRMQKANVKRSLRAGYRARAERDLEVVGEWEAANTGVL